MTLRRVPLAILLVVAMTFASAPQPAAALGNGPWIVVAHWDFSRGCISAYKGFDWLENIVKDTLPNEWQPFWLGESLKSGATIIRQDAWWFHADQSRDRVGFCPEQPVFAYDFRDSRMVYDPGSAGPKRQQYPTVDGAVNETNGFGWYDAGVSVYLRFNTCTQNMTQSLAGGNWPWFQIIQDTAGGVFTPTNAQTCTNQYPSAPVDAHNSLVYQAYY